MASKNNIGQRIRTMRLSREMTQADLAMAIDQSQSSITMYETGRREPDFETLEAMADVFNVPLVYLVDGGFSSASGSYDDFPDEDRPKNDDIRLLIRGLNKLSPEQVAQAKNVMKAMFAEYAEYFENGKESDQ